MAVEEPPQRADPEMLALVVKGRLDLGKRHVWGVAHQLQDDALQRLNAARPTVAALPLRSA